MPGNQTKPPVALRIVAGLFVVSAAFALPRMLHGLTDPPFLFNPWILGFWIGPGLLRGNRTWRRWALGLLVVQSVVLIPGALRAAGVMVPFPAVRMLGTPLEDLTVWGLLVAGLFASLLPWQVWILLRPEIRGRFVAAGQHAGQSFEVPT